MDYRNYGVRKRITLGRVGDMTEDKAMARIAEAEDAIAKARVLQHAWQSDLVSDTRPPDETGIRAATKQMRELLRSAKRRAAKIGVGFRLTDDDYLILVNESKGRCSLCGIAFTLARGSSWRRPFAPSIDRIKSDDGYSLENCRLVCVAVNFAMNEWGYEILTKVAMGLSRHVPQLRALKGNIID